MDTRSVSTRRTSASRKNCCTTFRSSSVAQQFFSVICDDDVANNGFSVTRSNMEEMVLKGPVNNHDVRVVNSYPIKVTLSRSRKVCLP